MTNGTGDCASPRLRFQQSLQIQMIFGGVFLVTILLPPFPVGVRYGQRNRGAHCKRESLEGAREHLEGSKYQHGEAATLWTMRLGEKSEKKKQKLSSSSEPAGQTRDQPFNCASSFSIRSAMSNQTNHGARNFSSLAGSGHDTTRD